ncbi:MAG: hypothetical protein SOX97_09850, partial [Sutterella sp.]|nr:hypothetical protein [Sutterella sp.]
ILTETGGFLMMPVTVRQKPRQGFKLPASGSVSCRFAADNTQLDIETIHPDKAVSAPDPHRRRPCIEIRAGGGKRIMRRQRM